jgi:hypothetical protein
MGNFRMPDGSAGTGGAYIPPSTGGGLLGMGAQGWGNTIGAFNTLSNAYFGNEMRKLGRDNLNFQKDSFEAQLANQAHAFNLARDNRAESKWYTSSSVQDEYQGDKGSYMAQQAEKYKVKDTLKG